MNIKIQAPMKGFFGMFLLGVWEWNLPLVGLRGTLILSGWSAPCPSRDQKRASPKTAWRWKTLCIDHRNRFSGHIFLMLAVVYCFRRNSIEKNVVYGFCTTLVSLLLPVPLNLHGCLWLDYMPLIHFSQRMIGSVGHCLPTVWCVG